VALLAGQALHWLKRARRADAELSAWLLRAMSVSGVVDHPHGLLQSSIADAAFTPSCAKLRWRTPGISYLRPVGDDPGADPLRCVAQRHKGVEGAVGRPFTFVPATTLQNVFVRRSGSKRRAILCAFNVDLPFKVCCGTPERRY
jgi:hypothetical protein